MNHSPEFRRIRKDVTEYLMKVGLEQTVDNSKAAVALPTVLPNTSREHQAHVKGVAVQALTAESADRYVEMSKVTKTFPSRKGPVTVVDGFDLSIHKGEFVTLIGHSGCGKSTVLSMVAGLTEISEGVITLDQRKVVNAGPDRGIVFQAPSLLPWLSAFDNVALGIEQVYPHATRQQRKEICAHYLERVGLAEAADKKAAELSNGMKQRVGIDEPFGMLDSLTRWDLQEVLMEVWLRSRLTAMMVTHDVDEAILLADRVVMMTNGPRAKVGRVLKIDLPRPRTRKMLLEHPDYYPLREELLGFLATGGHP
jgi:nitrate/nitrite transport system ATP-binding protein